MAETDRKMFLGGRLKRLRRELGHTQTRMAADLGVSPSYLNHLERNPRPMTAQVLLRLAQAYDLDLRAFSGDADKGSEADLQEVFADAMFRDLPIPRHEVTDLESYKAYWFCVSAIGTAGEGAQSDPALGRAA